MKKEEAIEILLAMKSKADTIHIKNAFGEWIYSIPGQQEAIDMAVSALMNMKEWE